jgi:CDP-glucose 4,6-dehydratase
MVDAPEKFNTAYNLGPEKTDVLTVEELAKVAIARAGSGSLQVVDNANKPHEAATLMLDISKAKSELQWQPLFSAKEAIEKTVDWYLSEEQAVVKCLQQIQDYFGASRTQAN